jgi:esterase/lipase
VKNRSGILISIVAAILILLSFSTCAGLNTHTKPIEISNQDLDVWLENREADIPGIIPGTEKIIKWAGNPNEKTPLSIVYIHGFTATRQETAPVFDRVAEQLNANIYYTRLKGHGRDAEAMKEANFNDWLNDSLEAVEIGKRIGERVVLVGMSTSSSFPLYLSTQVTGIDSLILISPNFAPADKAANVVLWPGGRIIVRLAVGKYNQFETKNEWHELYWTTPYRSAALRPMMKTVKLGQKVDLESIEVPILCVYTEVDTAVSIPAIKEAFQRFGSADKILVNIKEAQDHVLAGDIVSPNTTETLIQLVLDFLQEVP